MKVAFLDRDGTIIKDYPDEKWKDIEKPEFLDGSIEALKEINKYYKIIIITNQYIINDGIITQDKYLNINNQMLHVLKENNIDVLDVFFCPHSIVENCECMKPKMGMIREAIKKYPNIDMSKSFIVGDSISDIELGNNLGIKTFGINIDDKRFNFYRVKDLEEVKNKIFQLK